jgi:hypothetical protein
MPSIGNDLLSPIGRYFEKYVPALSYAVLIIHRGLQDLARSAIAAAFTRPVTSHRQAAIAMPHAALRQCLR